MRRTTRRYAGGGDIGLAKCALYCRCLMLILVLWHFHCRWFFFYLCDFCSIKRLVQHQENVIAQVCGWQAWTVGSCAPWLFQHFGAIWDIYLLTYLLKLHCGIYCQRCDLRLMSHHSSPPLDNIRVMVIVWKLRGNIIRTALCWIVWHNVHSQQHTCMSSSYRSNRLGLSHWDPYAVRRGGCL